jgi:hypothetical protein
MIWSFLRAITASTALLRSRRSPGRRRRPGPAPALESLEGRQLLTVTYHGGAVLPKVDVQALYLGSNWNTPRGHSQARYLEGFLHKITRSSYMDMLGQAGYDVGRGTTERGAVDPATIDGEQYYTNGQLQNTLQHCIKSGELKKPTANNLYVVYIEENVPVQVGDLSSETNLLGYHSSFAGSDGHGHQAIIHYAAIFYPGGSVGNFEYRRLAAVDQLTEVTSHELAEAVTDPNIGNHSLAWYDDRAPYPGEGEVGDLCDGESVSLDGYRVQEIAG